MEDSYQIPRIEATNSSYGGIYGRYYIRDELRQVTDEMIARMTTRNVGRDTVTNFRLTEADLRPNDHWCISNSMYYAPLMSTDSYATGRIHFGKNEGYLNVSKRPTQETLDKLYDLFGWYYVDI